MAEAEIVAGGPDADLTEHPGSGSYIGDQQAEYAGRCWVWINRFGDTCGYVSAGSVYDETAQEEVAACAGHIAATARGEVDDYCSIRPGQS